MLWIFIALAIGVIGTIAAFMVGEVRHHGGYNLTEEQKKTLLAEEKKEARVRRISAAAVTALVLIVTTFGFSLKTVDAGTVAVVYSFGEIVGQKQEGLQFVAPWQTTRRESLKVQRAQFDDVTTFSSETQDVFLVVTLNYSVAPEAVQELYREVGPNWFDVLVGPRINNYLKTEVVKYGTVDVAPNRDAIRTATEELLREDLAQFSITVVDLLMDDISFDPEFVQAIERKQIATQDAEAARNRVEEVRATAEQRVVAAEGDAEAEIIRAEAEAEANRLVAESLTPEVLQYRAIEKFSEDVEIALIPSGQGLILDPASLLGQLPNSNTGADE